MIRDLVINIILLLYAIYDRFRNIKALVQMTICLCVGACCVRTFKATFVLVLALEHLYFQPHKRTFSFRCIMIKVECPTVWSTQRQIRPFLHMY